MILLTFFAKTGLDTLSSECHRLVIDELILPLSTFPFPAAPAPRPVELVMCLEGSNVVR